MDADEYKKLLKKFHKLSDRHILVAETDMSYPDVQKVVNLSDRIRKAGNELVGVMKKNHDQLMRTKKYRKLLQLYGSTEGKKKRKTFAGQLNEMQEQYNVTWDFCRASMIPIGKKYGIDAIFALTKAEDVWRGVEKCLYGNGKMLHFSRYGDLPCIRAKQINRGIPMSVKNDELQFKLWKLVFGIQVKDRFQTDEVNAVLDYLAEPGIIDNKAVETLQDEAYCISTYRPCYATLVPKFIRGKYRVYLHLVIEGKAKPKYDSSGNPRHKYGINTAGASLVLTLAHRRWLILLIQRRDLKTYQKEATAYRNPNVWKDFITVPWTEAGVPRTCRIIMLMAPLRKGRRSGLTPGITKS